LEDFKAHKAAYNVIDAAKRVKIPWLILHGDEDINVPFSVAQHLAQAQPNAKLQKIEGANHVYGASHPYKEKTKPLHLKELCKKTLDFLK
jgi:pimeloyl-ACP methyl ester carboxylesterase